MSYFVGGYSSSPKWLLTWYIYPLFSGLAALVLTAWHETYDHWSVAVLTVTVHFIHFHFGFLFKLVAFCTEFNLLTPFVLFPCMIMDLPIFVMTKWATLMYAWCFPNNN